MENVADPKPTPPALPSRVAEAMSPAEERQWACFLHLSSFLGYVIPLGSILGPLVLWLIRRDQSAFVDEHGKEALNFQISILIYALVSIPLVFVLIGVFTLLAVGIIEIVFAIVAAVQASNGVHYRYPLTIRFLT